MQKRWLAELPTAAALVASLDALKARGAIPVDAYTPFPLRELEGRLHHRGTPIPWLVFAAGVTGGALAFLLQYWCAAIAYPLNVGGRPLDSAPAFIPITFETTILFAALTAFFSPLLFAKLPQLYQPIFTVDGFERTTVDRFWVVFDLPDEHAPPPGAEELGALRVLELPEAAP